MAKGDFVGIILGVFGPLMHFCSSLSVVSSLRFVICLSSICIYGVAFVLREEYSCDARNDETIEFIERADEIAEG